MDELQARADEIAAADRAEDYNREPDTVEFVVGCLRTYTVVVPSHA